MAIFEDSLFDNNSGTTISLDSPIEEHSRWICQHVYSKPYKNGHARTEHGPRHFSLAGVYSLMWANLRRRHGDPEAVTLTERQMKLIQIAAFWHDSGREGEAEDLWDNDSAINLYKYLTLTLGVSPVEAKLLAEAVANKDYYPAVSKKPYQELILGDNKQVKFVDCSEAHDRTIAQKLVHDADCLEILRARDNFDHTYLDFYKDFSVSDPQSIAASELSLVVAEARQLTYQQGDLMRHKDDAVRATYNIDIDVYKRHQRDLRDYRILQQLVLPNKLHDIPYLESLVFQYVPSDIKIGEKLSLENIHGMLNGSNEAPYLLFRGIGAPSAKVSNNKYDSAVTLEIRKILRPRGDMGRSTTLLPSETYTRSGLLIAVEEADFKHIQDISEKDSGTGVGKKSHLVSKSMDPQAAKQRMAELRSKQRLGKSDNILNHTDLKLCHSEILIILHKHMIKGIGFSRDLSTFNKNVLGDALKPIHPDVGLLEAYFTQQVYFRESGQILPLFEISYYSNQIREIDITETRIEKAWKDVCAAYIDQELREGRYLSLTKLNLDTVKINAVYGSKLNMRAKENQSVDLLYDDDFKNKINGQIQEVLKTKIAEYTQKFITLLGQYSPDSPVDQFFTECAKTLNMPEDEFVFLLVNIRLNNQSLKPSVDPLLNGYLKSILEGSVEWAKHYINKDSFSFGLSSNCGSDIRSRKLVTLFHLLALGGCLDRYIPSFCDNFSSQLESKNPEVVSNFYGLIDDLLQMESPLLSDKVTGIIKMVSSSVCEHFDAILNSPKTSCYHLLQLTKVKTCYLDEMGFTQKLWAKIKEKIQKFDPLFENDIGPIVNLIRTEELKLIFKERINSFFHNHQAIDTIIKIIQDIEPSPSDEFFEKMLQSSILKAGLNHSMHWICDFLEKIQGALPDQLFSSSQKNIIKNLLLTLCKRDLYKIADLSAIINSFVLIEGIDAIPLPIAQKYFFAYLYRNELNIWAPPNPNLDRILAHFLSLGVNIDDIKKKVRDTVDKFAHQNKTQVSKIDYEAKIRDMGLKKSRTALYIYYLSEISRSKPKLSRYSREDIQEDKSLTETQKDELLKLADDMCKYYKTMNEAIDFLTAESGLVDPSCSGDKMTKLVCSYYDQVTASNSKAPVSFQSTPSAPMSAEIPVHNDRLKQSVRKNTEKSVEAAIKIQSFFRRRQAQKALVQLKTARDEQALQKIEREKVRAELRLKEQQANAAALKAERDVQARQIHERNNAVSTVQKARTVHWSSILCMVMFCLLGIVGFSLFTVGVASAIGIPIAMTVTGTLFSFLPWSTALTATVIGFITHIVSGFCIGATDLNPRELPHSTHVTTTTPEFDESVRFTALGSEFIQKHYAQVAVKPAFGVDSKGGMRPMKSAERDCVGPRRLPLQRSRI